MLFIWQKSSQLILLSTSLLTIKIIIASKIEKEARYLSPYPCDEKYETWKKLTTFITKETVKRVSPLCHRISPSTQVDCTAELEKKERKRLSLPDSNNEFFNHVKIRFTKIPEQKYPDGATPHEITKYSMDYSFALESMLQKIDSSRGKSRLLFDSLLILSVSFLVMFWVLF